MNGRNWRVVTLDGTGDVVADYGYMFDEPTARRVQRRFTEEGAVVQYQPPPTVHRWTIVDPRAPSRKQPQPAASQVQKDAPDA